MKKEGEDARLLARCKAKRKESFQKSYMKVGGQEVVTSGYGASKDVESACSWDGSKGKVKFWEADGSSRAKKGHDFVVFTEAFGFEVEEQRSTLATQTWAEGTRTGTWYTEQKEAWLNQIPEVQMLQER